MDQQQQQNPPPSKSEKIFDELPTFIGSSAHTDALDTSADYTRYELDSQFSIYKVGEERKSPSLSDDRQQQHQPQPLPVVAEKFNVDDPNAFIIQPDSTACNQQYVDLDFDYNAPTEPISAATNADQIVAAAQPSVLPPAAPSAPPAAASEANTLAQEASFVVSNGSDDSFAEKLKEAGKFNLLDETLDSLVDMSASIISQGDNSISENIDFPSSIASNVDANNSGAGNNNKPFAYEPASLLDETPLPEMMLKSADFTQIDDTTFNNLETSQTGDVTTNDQSVVTTMSDSMGDSSHSLLDNTILEAHKVEDISAITTKSPAQQFQTEVAPSPVSTIALDNFETDVPQPILPEGGMERQVSLSKLLDEPEEEQQQLPSHHEEPMVPSTATAAHSHQTDLVADHLVDDHFEPRDQSSSLMSDPDEDFISQFTSSVPPTIPEEVTEEVSTSFSTFTPEQSSAPAALLAEQVILPDSSNESDAEHGLVDSGDNSSSKEPSKPSSIEASPVNEQSVTDQFASLEQHHQVPIQTNVPEVKTVDLQPGFVEEFVVEESPAQHFVEEEPVTKRESLVDELLVQSSPPPVVPSLPEPSQPVVVEKEVEEEHFAASESAPTFAAPPPAPVLSTFALSESADVTPSLVENATAADTSVITDHITAAGISSTSSLAEEQKPIESAVVSGNTLAEEANGNVAQVATVDKHDEATFVGATAVEQQPADGLKKEYPSESGDLFDTVAAVTSEPIISTSTTAPVASSLPSSPSPPPSPKVAATEAAAAVVEEPVLEPPQPQYSNHSPEEQKQQQTASEPVPQQSEHENEETIIESSSTNLLHTSACSTTSADQVLSALPEEAEEEEELTPPVQPQKQQTTWSRDNDDDKQEEEASTQVQEVVLANANLEADTSDQSLSTSASQPVTATAAEVPNTRSPVSLASSSAPDTTTSSASTTIMGRKNFRRDNSSDNEPEYSGPDQVKEYIETVLGPNVAELVYWRDPKNTGIVFGIGLAILLSLSIFSVISVVAYTLLFTLLGTLSFRVYKNVLQAVQKTSEGHPFKEYLEIEIAPSQERIHEIVDSLVSHGTCFVNRMRSVLLIEDIVDSLKYLLIFWALTYIGAWFNGLTLVILAYISAFSLPKVYEQNKAQIDQYLELVNGKITEISDKVPFLKKVPVEKKEE